MPFLAPAINDEREALLAFLNQQRDAVRAAAYGLTDQQATATPSASALSVGGIVKHLAIGEWGWIVERVAQSDETPPFERNDDWGATHQLLDGETLEWALDLYDKVARRTEEIVRSLEDLGATFKAPEFPWFSTEGMYWSPRWVLLHLIEETARHAGHADIVRETLDGKNAFELIDALDASRPTHSHTAA
jgi:uncharacterized damage-inducible protein DinB